MTVLPKPGDTIGGKYRIVRLLGEGGMGAVFEAQNVVTRKRVALKWILPRASHEKEASARLVREAQAAARVRHPNVVDVYDLDRAGDSVFLVMEFLEGKPLTDVLEERTLEMYELIALLLPAMRGVAEAHRQGVVHRDIKPDNIFLARETDVSRPVPKILDFGVSKLDSRDGEQLTLTRTGGTVGTPMYMSYEQLAALPEIDGRADIYAFGVILYEALTGSPPYEASTFSELVVKVSTQSPVPPKELRPEIPTALGQLVLWAMARNRERRIQTMEALIQELEPFATAHGFRAHMTMNSGSLPSLAVGPKPAARRQGELAAQRAYLDAPIARSEPAHATHPSLRRGANARRTIVLGAFLSIMLGALGFREWRKFESSQQTAEPNRTKLPATLHAPARLDAEVSSQPAASQSLSQDAEAAPMRPVQALAPETLRTAQPRVAPRPDPNPKQRGLRAAALGRVERPKPGPASNGESERRPANAEPATAVKAVEPSGAPKHRVNREPARADF